MQFDEFIWPDERIEHIAAHGVVPDEVEEICFAKPMILRTKSLGKNPVYYVYGQTRAGRYLLCIVIQFPEGKCYPVTARDMTTRERRRYQKWKKR
jgi:uncharacterized DUF497 family protein